MFLPPATKLGQGYIFTGVCDSVHRGGLPQCMLGYHPPARQTPSKETPLAGQTPPGRADPHSPHQGDIDRRYSQQAGGICPTGMQFLLHLSVSHFVRGGVRGRGVCMAGGARVAGETATEAGGMHPTRMHSCLEIYVFRE